MLDKIGKYDIRLQIGRGAMGVVYEAWDRRIERRVALKTLRTDQFDAAQLPDLLARFKREAQSVGRLSHPHIVTIHDYGDWEGTPYIVMEYISGRELAHDLQRRARFPLEDVVRIMTQMLGALGHAHERGVVHRDLKPANMFLLEDGSLKVVDFGIARLDDADVTLLTRSGDVLGTPAYMSPEQVDALPVDHRSDLFSAGIILYELLVGERPFKGESVHTVKQAVRKLEPLAPSEANPTLSGAWDKVISRALAKKPAARYESARQFAEAVKAAFQAERAHAEEGHLKAAEAAEHALRAAEERSRAESLRRADDERREAERLAGAEAEARQAAQERARREAEARAVADAQVKKEAAESALRVAEERSRAETLRRAEDERRAERVARDETEARQVAEERARREAEARAAAEAQAQAKRQAAERARLETEERARRQAEDKARSENQRKVDEARREAAQAASRAPVAGKQGANRVPAIAVAILFAAAVLGAALYTRQGAQDRASKAEAARVAAESRATEEAEKRAKAEALAREEAERRSKLDADAAKKEADAKRESELAAKTRAEEEAKKAAEEKTKALALRKEEDERKKAEVEARKEAEGKAKAEFDARRKAEEQAQAEARRRVEEQAKTEADARRRVEDGKTKAEALRADEELARRRAELERKQKEAQANFLAKLEAFKNPKERVSVGAKLDDEDIQLRARNRINERLGDAVRLKISSFNRVVLVLGEVPNTETGIEIEKIVRSVPHVRHVTSDLRVGTPVLEVSQEGDARLAAFVRYRFLASGLVGPRHVEVAVHARVVYLTGIVTVDEGNEATEIARITGEVRKVVKVFEYCRPSMPPCTQ